MIRALESIQRTVNDILDPVRRAGPTSKTQNSKSCADGTLDDGMTEELAQGLGYTNVHELMRELRLKDD
jgi:hypothetical protein